MKILYMSPRLDISFKPTPHVPLKEGPPNNPVRLHYVEFERRIREHCEKYNHELTVLKKPMWEFTPDDAKDYDVGLMLHREKHDFPGENILYCMQMGIPFLFSIDHQGWCATDSRFPLNPNKGSNETDRFDELYKEIVLNNVSKFSQPKHNVKLPEKYILFTAQLPHDTVIKNHSNISVDEAIRHTLDFGKRNNIPVVVKGHPVNLGSMIPLMQTFNKHADEHDMWVNEANIHECLRNCEAMFTVNSGGTGLEAILHRKPIVCFGNADYNGVTIPFHRDMQIDTSCKNYTAFINHYLDVHFNIRESFDKLENILCKFK